MSCKNLRKNPENTFNDTGAKRRYSLNLIKKIGTKWRFFFAKNAKFQDKQKSRIIGNDSVIPDQSIAFPISDQSPLIDSGIS